MMTGSAPEPLWALRRKNHTSISAVKEFVMCPRRYFFHYVEQRQPAFKAAAAAFGSAWHSVIQYWLTREGVGQDELETYFRDDLLARLQESKVPVIFDDEDENEGRLTDTGLKMLRVFLARVRRPEVVLGVEVPFSMELTHPGTGEVLGVPLIGAVDAVLAEEGQKFILELKSAKRKWPADSVELDLQVSVYARLAARHLGHPGTPVRLLITTKTVHPEVQVENPVRHEADEMEVLDVIFGVHAAVAAGVDYRNRVGWQCRSCPYAEPCRS